MNFEDKLKKAQDDSKRLDSSERVCFHAANIFIFTHEGKIHKAYCKSTGHIEWFCEACIEFFDSIIAPYHGKDKSKGLHPDYLACFEIQEESVKV